jgi:hypothetical protein
VGSEKRLVEHIEDYLEGRSENSHCQVEKEEEVILSESHKNSKDISYHQGFLTEEEDQRHNMIIGGLLGKASK